MCEEAGIGRMEEPKEEGTRLAVLGEDEALQGESLEDPPQSGSMGPREVWDGQALT